MKKSKRNTSVNKIDTSRNLLILFFNYFMKMNLKNISSTNIFSKVLLK